MKKKVLLMIPLAFLMLFAAAAPVMAYDPKPCFSFTQGQWGVNIPPPPGIIIIKNNIEIGIDVEAINYRYSSMFGYSVATETESYYGSLVTYTGGGFGIVICTAKGSTWIEQYTVTFNGLGSYTYEGPTFTALGITYTTGETGFFGLLTEGSGTVVFISGPYAGETGVFTFAGCYTAVSGISYWTYHVG